MGAKSPFHNLRIEIQGEIPDALKRRVRLVFLCSFVEKNNFSRLQHRKHLFIPMLDALAPLPLGQLIRFLESGKPLKISAKARQNILKSRHFLDQKIKNSPTPIYGINTGFGSLCNTEIEKEKLADLQANLVRSHACGLGNPIPKEIVKLMLFLKVRSLSYGYSGVQLATVQRLVDFYNHDILPLVYEQGSLGASGDLAPLAHLALPLLGEGKVWYQNRIVDAKTVLAEKGWQPLSFGAKEGLALINGTQFMSAYMVWLVAYSKRLLQWADLISALSLDAFDCRLEPFDALTHHIRPHKGQIETAQIIRHYLAQSPIARQEKKAVQDPYSFRCIPQVHGASKDALLAIRRVITTEINAVTDNPNIFPDQDKILSGGNFHGQTLAIHLDFLAIALAEIANISERRLYLLLSGQRGLPPFLVKNSGLHSGFMIAQYSAASIVSQNKQLCTPASVDSIVSSNGQEDHVSMGANAATKAYQVVRNVEKVLAIELLAAAQALDLRRPQRSAPILEKLVTALRAEVPFLEKDRFLGQDLQKGILFLQKQQPKDFEA